MNLWQNNEFRIENEDGITILPYDELVRSPLLEQIRGFLPKFGINTRKGVILGRTILTYDKEYLADNPGTAEALQWHINENLANPLAFYAPYGDGTLNFINDITSKIVFLKAGNRCLTADTVIDTPDGPREIQDLYDQGEPFRVWAWDGKNPVVAWANPVFKKPGLHECYRILTPHGEFSASGAHRILSGDRYVPVASLVSLLSRSRSTSDIALSVGAEDDRRSRQRAEGCLDDYSAGPRLYDEPLRLLSDIVRSFLPSPGDVLRRTASGNRPHSDDRDSKYICILSGIGPLLSIQDATLHAVVQSHGGSLSRDACTSAQWYSDEHQSDQRSLAGSSEYESVGEVLRCRYGQSVPFATSNAVDCIIAANKVGRKEVFDFEVPGYHNYVTAGLVHHNSGKSCAIMIKRLLRMVETDPEWPIFTDHGVQHRPFLPSMGACASYKWEHIREVLAPELFRWMPLYEIPDMCPQWRGGEDGYRQRSWQDRPSITISNGAGYRFHAYKQSQSTFESSAFEAGWDWDEQPEHERWKGANERMGTSRVAQHNFALTPHRLDDMEGGHLTGAGTFLEEIWNGNDLQGYAAHQVSRYEIHRLNPEWDPGIGGNAHTKAAKILKELEAGKIMPGGDCPDWIYPEDRKIEAYRALTNALEKRNKRDARRHHSRNFGSFERSETSLVPEYDESIHLIDPFPIPYHRGTLYRYIDPGRNAPCACLWSWVPQPGLEWEINGKMIQFPRKEVVVIFFREYYEPGRIISQNARGIIEASGNNRRQLKDHITRQGQTYERFEESPAKELYYRTAGDPAALGKPSDESDMTVGELYALNGLRIEPATRMLLKSSSQIVSEWFGVDEDRQHVFYDKPGFTKSYIFPGLVNLRRELRTLVDPEEWKGRPQADHLYDCARYEFIHGPVHVPGHYFKSQAEREDEKDLDNDERVGVGIAYDPVTGYPIYNFPWGG